MNYQTSTSLGVATDVPVVSEIQRESNELDKAIQQMFDNCQELSKRLTPVLSQYPSPPTEDQKSPEEALSDIGSKLRANRRAVEGINGTLNRLLKQLAL